MIESTLVLLVITIIFSYIYAFVSGFTDAANAIATSVGSRALSPLAAVLMAGILETVGALTGTAVALTIGKGIVELGLISMTTVLAALIGAMAWSLLTYAFGIPVSETHGLIGAVVGAALAKTGSLQVVIWSGLTKVLVAIIVSPLLGFLGGAFLMGIIYFVFQKGKAKNLTPVFRNLQRLSSAFMAFSHGRNDAQKPMGVLVMALALYYSWAEVSVPIWVVLSVGLAAGLGVAFGGWRIIKTLGLKVTNLTVEQGFSAETSAALVLQGASVFGIPVSTTHTITSSIVGAGAAKRVSTVRWQLVLDIVLSWIFTLPATVMLGWIAAKILGIIFAG